MDHTLAVPSKRVGDSPHAHAQVFVSAVSGHLKGEKPVAPSQSVPLDAASSLHASGAPRDYGTGPAAPMPRSRKRKPDKPRVVDLG